jgi:hypothetical protein
VQGLRRGLDLQAQEDSQHVQGLRRGLNLQARRITPMIYRIQIDNALLTFSTVHVVLQIFLVLLWGLDLQARQDSHSVQGVRRGSRWLASLLPHPRGHCWRSPATSVKAPHTLVFEVEASFTRFASAQKQALPASSLAFALNDCDRWAVSRRGGRSSRQSGGSRSRSAGRSGQDRCVLTA